MTCRNKEPEKIQVRKQGSWVGSKSRPEYKHYNSINFGLQKIRLLFGLNIQITITAEAAE